MSAAIDTQVALDELRDATSHIQHAAAELQIAAPAAEASRTAQARADEAAPEDQGFQAYKGVVVAITGLLVLLGIVALAITELPSSSTTRSQDIVALSTAAFGVIGAVTAAYFGVRAANQAVRKMERVAKP